MIDQSNPTIVIDTDPGVDDILAIFFALGSKAVQVAGCTTCMGNAPLDIVTRNLAFALGAVGHESVPIYTGAAAPSNQAPVWASTHGVQGLGRIVPDPFPIPTAGSARDKFTRGAALPYQLVALAPLTNIAQALSTDPRCFDRCSRLIILGGAITAPGNKSAVAEFNFFSDPEAADAVLAQCPCPITLIPLDLCYTAVIALSDLERVEDPEFRSFLMHLCEPYAVGGEREEGIPGIILYDPLAVFAAIAPDAFTYTPAAVRVDTGQSHARGMSVADRRLRSTTPPNVTVATAVDLDTFKISFFAALNRLRYAPRYRFRVT